MVNLRLQPVVLVLLIFLVSTNVRTIHQMSKNRELVEETSTLITVQARTVGVGG